MPNGSTIEQPGEVKQKIIFLGKDASPIASSLTSYQTEIELIYADTLAKVRMHADPADGAILLISRDMENLTEEDLLSISDLYFQLIVWPPDDVIPALIRIVAARGRDLSAAEPVIDTLVQSSEILLKKNQELSGRITALEAVVRSLLAALSQYDPAVEAYAGEEDAWELMMQGLPAAGQAPEEYSEEEYDDSDEDMEEDD